VTAKTARRTGLRLALFAYVFFLSIEAMGSGMKASFKDALKTYLLENAETFTELMSFVIGIIGTSLVQSSSTVTSMAVVLTQENIVPILISVGIVHGANLGTSVTSSIVAFFSNIPPLPKNPLSALKTVLFTPREGGFERAVATGVVHGLFNAVLVTLLLLCVELPFGAIHRLSELTAGVIGRSLEGSNVVMDVLSWVSPKTYTKPVIEFLFDLGTPAPVVVILGFVLMFIALRGFSRTMRKVIMGSGLGTDSKSLEAIGDRLLGKTWLDTFARGLILTILVQSSSATTSMVVPLAALGLFRIKRILPFILGANIGTTTTALIAAASDVGGTGFEAGLTIALAHFYLNTAAVVLVVMVPPLRDSVLGVTAWLARAAGQRPIALLGYLATMAFIIPGVVFVLPTAAATSVIAVILALLIVLPHVLGAPRLDRTMDSLIPEDAV
jgi:sodium-dependent phosphate cotransporter